jgi:hypothetical protein
VKSVLSRRARPPAELVAHLAKSERVVSWADGDDGAVVLATTRGIWWPDAGEQRFIGWQHIDKVVWRDGVITLTEAEVVDDELLVDRPDVSLRIVTPRDFPPTVRKRVEANVVRSEVYPVAGGSARFVARRIPGRDGLVWWARLEPGTRDSGEVRAHIARRIEQLKGLA